jgi:hypothetical protein
LLVQFLFLPGFSRHSTAAMSGERVWPVAEAPEIFIRGAPTSLTPFFSGQLFPNFRLYLLAVEGKKYSIKKEYAPILLST